MLWTFGMLLNYVFFDEKYEISEDGLNFLVSLKSTSQLIKYYGLNKSNPLSV